jgi:hypothetical protein
VRADRADQHETHLARAILQRSSDLHRVVVVDLAKVFFAACLFQRAAEATEHDVDLRGLQRLVRGRQIEIDLPPNHFGRE